MSDRFASLNGHRLTSLKVTVGFRGPWVAECELDEAPKLSGRVTIHVAGLDLVGTIVPESDGAFEGQRKCRVVAGAGGWRSQVPAKHYHNDAHIKARTIAEDAAREVGESIGTFVPSSERIGPDYVRQAGPASTVLEGVIGQAPWWVDAEGVTQVGPRPTTIVDAEAYEVVAYEPMTRLVTLAVDDPRSINIGATVSKSLDAPQTIRDFELVVDGEDLRIIAWCGEGEAGRLPGLLASIISKVNSGKLYGKYRYRVVRMSGDRVELQAVRRSAGLPDVLPVSMWPGVAGVHADLTPGSIVLVEFIEGDRSSPIVTHYEGKDGSGFVPQRLTIGGETGSEAARLGDTVEVLLPPAMFSGVIGGAPSSGVLTFPMSSTLGTITSGSGKVRIAS